MATNTIKPPEGFILDKPKPPSGFILDSVPEGFVVDEPEGISTELTGSELYGEISEYPVMPDFAPYDPSQPPIPGGAVESPFGIFIKSYGQILSGIGIPFERFSKAVVAPIAKLGLAFTPDVKNALDWVIVERQSAANTVGLGKEAKKKEMERLRQIVPYEKPDRTALKEMPETLKNAAKALVPLPGMTKDTESVAQIASKYYEEMTGEKPPFWYGGAMDFAATIVTLHGVQRAARFVAGFAKWAKGKPQAQIRPARAEADAAWANYQRTGDRTQWDAVRVKYAGIKPEGIERIRARAKPPTVEEFGKYPLAKPIKRPPTVGKLAPREPVAPEKPAKAVEIPPKAAEAKPEKIIHKIRKMTPEEIAEDKAFWENFDKIKKAVHVPTVEALKDTISKRIDLLEKVKLGILTQQEADTLTRKFAEAAKLRIEAKPEPEAIEVTRRTKLLTEDEVHSIMSESLDKNEYAMYLQDEVQARTTGDQEAATRAFDKETQVMFERGYLYNEKQKQWARVTAEFKAEVEKAKAKPEAVEVAPEVKGLTKSEQAEFEKLKSDFNRQLIGFQSPEAKRLVELERKSLAKPPTVAKAEPIKEVWQLTPTNQQAIDLGFTKNDQAIFSIIEGEGGQVNLSGVPIENWYTYNTPEGLAFQSDIEIIDEGGYSALLKKAKDILGLEEAFKAKPVAKAEPTKVPKEIIKGWLPKIKTKLIEREVKNLSDAELKRAFKGTAAENRLIEYAKMMRESGDLKYEDIRVAEPTKVEKEVKYEEKAIIEPIPGPKVEPRKAGKIVPTGKPAGTLDPTNYEDAIQITKLHAQWVAGGWRGEPRNVWIGVYSGKEVIYNSEQINAAYRTIQKSVPSPMPDVELFAMPGKEAQVQGIAQKMAKLKGVIRPRKKGIKPLPKPTALPKVAKDKEGHVKAVYAAADKTKEGRPAISGVKVEGDTIVATDGRRLFWAKGEWGKDGLYLDAASLKKGLLGKPTKDIKFPAWRDIVPDVSKRDAILVRDLETALRHVRQAASITTEESKGITIIENKDGSLGFAAAAPEVGHVEINVMPGSRILGSINPQYLLDAIKFHAIRGDTAFEFYFKDWDRPVLTRSLNGKTNTLTMPINPGDPSEAIKKAISEWPIKPKGKPGFIDVRPLLKVHKTFMGIVEPAKAVEMKLGKEPYAAVIKGIHYADVGRIEFTEAQIEGQDKSLGQLSEWFNKFPDKELKYFMLSRGEPTTENARLIQRSAMEKLPKELRRGDLFNTVQRIADSNYKYLQSVVGDDIHRVEDYFYGIYKNPKAVDKFLDYWRTTKRFTKEKKLPTVADAVDYGLELRNYNPIENLKAEYIAISHLEGMNWMKDELMRTGKGKFIDNMFDAPVEWDIVKDPVFKELRLQPELAKLINNLIATNKITRIPLANTLRQINNVARTVKFIGSAFHLLSVTKQSLADSGYFGFLYKPTALRGFTTGFRANDPIFRTTAYKDYIRHGGGHRYSVESEARRTFNRAVNELNRNMGMAVRVGALPLKIPTGFVNWMFQSYIPKVKYSKFLDVMAEQEKKLKRKLTSPEKIDIIKEQQNFYGMMNERLFGRSGTVTSALRFYFMSPGYAEGNYRTMLKAATQWGGKAGFKANRSRSNIVNSWLITAAAATAATLTFTGKPPEKPETLDDARDLFKIDTGKKDEKGRKIMIDLMTYDKDYWNVAFNTLRLRPDVAVGKSWRRIGGMKAPTAEIIVDLALMSMGKAIYDWKGDRVVEITDPFLLKAMKLTTYEVKNLVPISVSVFQQSKKRDIDTTVAAIETLLGFRPTKTEKELREQKLISKMYSLAGQREELSYYIGKSTDPKRTVEKYNKTVNGILESPYIPKAMKDEWGPKLLIDYENVVTWKRFPAGKMTDPELQRAYDAHTLSIPYKRRGEPFRPIGAPKKGSERRVSELKAEAQKRGIELKRGPRKPPRR